MTTPITIERTIPVTYKNPTVNVLTALLNDFYYDHHIRSA